ncbi:hypothetical protein OIDMADRAFT_27993 [Oidiodendron maius Zn]|uniref:Uncharacterized protein n=1 Tax=Oidiodendron maius (strain Zn) TaxID=913774 RepID=A0A0C3HFD1_OIDMZ|nr:hypothetical protein OIDMADRAFT_27993 [Oidiodendron maius Zn]
MGALQKWWRRMSSRGRESMGYNEHHHHRRGEWGLDGRRPGPAHSRETHPAFFVPPLPSTLTRRPLPLCVTLEGSAQVDATDENRFPQSYLRSPAQRGSHRPPLDSALAPRQPRRPERLRTCEHFIDGRRSPISSTGHQRWPGPSLATTLLAPQRPRRAVAGPSWDRAGPPAAGTRKDPRPGSACTSKKPPGEKEAWFVQPGGIPIIIDHLAIIGAEGEESISSRFGLFERLYSPSPHWRERERCDGYPIRAPSQIISGRDSRYRIALPIALPPGR